MRTRLLSALAAALALTATGRSADPPRPRLETRIFHVADLVTPIPDAVLPGPGGNASVAERWKKPTPTESAAQLTRLVTGTVRADSWDRTGGPGSIKFAETACALQVINTAEVVAEVATLLDGLRRLQDVSVSCEVRVLTVPTGFCDRVGLKTTGDAVLTDREVRVLMETVQGNRDATVTQFPKITSFDGQIATVRAGEQQIFTTGIETVRVKGEIVCVPVSKPVDLGDSLVLCSRVATDESSVTLRAQFTRTSLVGTVDLLPVTTRITPVFEGGSRGKPVPFTQHLQAPSLDTKSTEKTAVVPDGGTIVLGSWKESGGKSKTTLSTTGGVPYMNQLFKTVGPAGDHEVVVLATVRVIRETAEVAPAPKPVSPPVAPMPHSVRADEHSLVSQSSAVTCAPTPTACEPGRPMLTCPKVAPALPLAGLRSYLPPEMELVVAEAHLAAALADPPPQNGNDLLEMARVRYARVLAKDPQNRSARLGIAKVHLITAAGKPSEGLSAPTAVTPASGVQETVAIKTGLHTAHEVTPADSLVVRMTIARVHAGFARDAGLADTKAGDFEDKWVLTDREARLLTASLRRDPGNTVVSQPMISLADRQTGFVQVGSGKSPAGGTTVRLTPAVTADGKKVVLRGVAEIAEPSTTGGAGVYKITVTETVPLGNTLVVRGVTNDADEKATEILILMTVDQPATVHAP